MKKNIKRIWGILLIITLLFTINAPVYAKEKDYQVGDVVDGSILTNDDYTEMTAGTLTRGNYLNRGMASLTDKGGGVVNSYGAVMAGVVCDKLILKMTLQRLEGDTWVTVKNYSDTSYNSSLLTKSYNLSVKKGYYYRLKAACVAFKGGTSESQMPVTNGIWID